MAPSWDSFPVMVGFGIPALRRGYLAAGALLPLGKKKSLRILLSFPPFDGFSNHISRVGKSGSRKCQI